MGNISFGLIGYGAWGTCHARAIQESPGCELRAICARSEEAQQAAKKTGAVVYGDYQDLLKQSDLDVIDVVLPNHLHEAVAVAALEQGKHVLLEKPMSTSIGSCDRLIETARKVDRRLLIGHEMRFSPMYAEIRRLIDSGRLGEPRYILMDLWRRPYRSGSDGWRMDPVRVGNWILEEPVHLFDAAAWYLDRGGDPAAVYAFGNRRQPDAPSVSGINDNFTAIITYPNGAYATISQSLAAVEHHLSVKVFGSEASLRAEWHAELDRSEHPSYSLELSEGETLKSVEVPGTPGELFELQQEIAAMARAVRNGEVLPISPQEARRAVMLCLEAMRSLETGEVVQLSRPATSIS